MIRKSYSDYIGLTIVKYLEPVDCFYEESPYDCLESHLAKKIKRELGWLNGLICRIENISVKIVGNKIAISGIITKSETTKKYSIDYGYNEPDVLELNQQKRLK